MSDETNVVTLQELRTPQSAAIAGVVFALLLGVSMVLIQLSIPSDPPTDAGWLGEHEGRITLAVTLVPLSGIAFLWFIGVIRARLGRLEDQFFSTVFMGSGLLFLAGLFVWISAIAAAMASSNADPDGFAGSSSYVFAGSLIKVLGSVVLLRMGGVFMFSTATMWLRTRLMPRWLVYVTYATAVVLLLGGVSTRAVRLAFPIWVLVVSVMILLDESRMKPRERDGVER